MSAIPISLPDQQDDDPDEILRRTGAQKPVPSLAIPTGAVQGANQGQAIPTDATPDQSQAIPTTPTPLHHQAGVASLWSKADNIHNPVLRVLGKIGAGLAKGIDVAGSIAAPGIAAQIPGSTLHEQAAENQERRQAAEDITNQGKQAVTAHTQAETEAIPAETGLKEAQTEALKNPKPEKPGTPEAQVFSDLLTQPNPTTGKVYTPIEAFEKVKQTAQDVKPEPTQPAHVTYDSGIPVSVTGPDKKVYDVNDPNLPPELKPLVQAATRAHGQHLTEEAAKTAAAQAQQQRMFDQRQNALTSSTKTMIESAPGVLSLSKRIRGLVDAQKSSLGPAASRWAEFMAGKVGAPNPEFTKLRTDVGLLTTKLMRMHVGSRGGEMMMQHFKDLIDVSKQDPENLKAALDEIDAYAKEVQQQRPGAGGSQDEGTARFAANGKTYNIPADKVDAFKKAHPEAKAQ